MLRIDLSPGLPGFLCRYRTRPPGTARIAAADIEPAGSHPASTRSSAESTIVAAGGFTLAGSGAILVPLQRPLIQGTGPQPDVMRRRWYRGQLARTIIALTSLALLAVGAA